MQPTTTHKRPNRALLTVIALLVVAAIWVVAAWQTGRDHVTVNTDNLVTELCRGTDC